MTWQPEYANLFVALVLGMAIGWERSLEGKPAGYRTHGLVAIGAAGILLAERTARIPSRAATSSTPTPA